MRGLRGYATENLQLRKNLHSTHLCGGYAEVMRRFLFCGGCVEQFPMRRFGGPSGTLDDCTEPQVWGPCAKANQPRTIQSTTKGKAQPKKAQPRTKHNQGQSTTKVTCATCHQCIASDHQEQATPETLHSTLCIKASARVSCLMLTSNHFRKHPSPWIGGSLGKATADNSKHNQGQSTTPQSTTKDQAQTKQGQSTTKVMRAKFHQRTTSDHQEKRRGDYTVLQGFCANLMSNAAQQPFQSASIALDWQGAAQSKSSSVSRSADLTGADSNTSGLAVRCFFFITGHMRQRRLTPWMRPVTC